MYPTLPPSAFHIESLAFRPGCVVVEGSGSVLMYRCPSTSLEVMSAIDTDRETLARMKQMRVSVSCPRCGACHSIPAAEMFFEPGAAFSVNAVAMAGE